jgi:hypothetical protein
MRDFIGRIAGLKITHKTVEQGRRYRDITVRREAVANIADMAVDAENLLRDHHCALWLAGRIGAIGGERVAVAGGEREMPGQIVLP